MTNKTFQTAFLTIIFALTFYNAFSQGENIFKIGASWGYTNTLVNWQTMSSTQSNYVSCYATTRSVMTITKDTIIGTKKFFKLNIKRKVTGTSMSYNMSIGLFCQPFPDSITYGTMLLRYDTLHKQILTTTNQIVYQFKNYHVGDTLPFLNSCYPPATVKHIDTIHFYNQLLTRYEVKFDSNHWKPRYNNSYIIEGIGGLPGFFDFHPIETDTLASLSGPQCQAYEYGDLICFQIGDSVYKSNQNAVCISADSLTITGIDKQPTVNLTNIAVYPNPTNGQTTITTSYSLNKATLKLYNLTGQIILSKDNLSGNKFNIDIARQTNGIYILELIDNGQTTRTKLIKE